MNGFSVMPLSGPSPMGLYGTFAAKTKLVHHTCLKYMQITSTLSGHTYKISKNKNHKYIYWYSAKSVFLVYFSIVCSIHLLFYDNVIYKPATVTRKFPNLGLINYV